MPACRRALLCTVEHAAYCPILAYTVQALIEKNMAASRTPLSAAVVQTDMLCHRHQKYMHAARELQSDLRTGLLQNLDASITELNRHIQENDVGVAWSAKLNMCPVACGVVQLTGGATSVAWSV